MNTKNKTILLVEDDPAIIDIYEAMIKRAGFDVKVMSLGQDVITAVKQVEAGEFEKPDLVLLDLTLPDVNGMEVLTAIRNNAATKDMVVFILTNQQESESPHPEGITPDKFLIKANITPTELVDYIKQELK